MCGYCDKDKDGGVWVIGQGKDPAAMINVDEKYLFIFDRETHSHTDVEISYCPFCGRKL